MDSSAKAVVGLYERHAKDWVADRQRTAFVELAWLERFCSMIPVGRSILDIGCGCGAPIGEFLLVRGYDVCGIDSSSTLISLCRDRFPNQRWLVSDMRTLALKDRFQGLVAWDSFFHLSPDDQAEMFPVFAEHAAPGAALMFTSGPEHGEAVGSYAGEKLYHASLAPDEYRSLFEANGFAVRGHIARDPQCGGRTVWLAQAVD
jgi:SAM-dependent methyltransferase